MKFLELKLKNLSVWKSSKDEFHFSETKSIKKTTDIYKLSSKSIRVTDFTCVPVVNVSKLLLYLQPAYIYNC